MAIQNSLQNPELMQHFQNLIHNPSQISQLFGGNCCTNKNSNSNTESTQGSGGQQPTRPGSGNQQSQSGSSQPAGQTDPSGQGNNGMIGYIPIVFFPCGGQNGANGNGNGNGNQYAMPYPYQQQQQPGSGGGNSGSGSSNGGNNPCAQCPGNSNASQRSHPLFGAISNARIFHNSDFNSVTQVKRSPFVRSRKAKVDQTIAGPPA